MEMWAKEAVLVYTALLNLGLETPYINNAYNNEERLCYITTYIMKIMKLLNLNIEEESLIDTPQRIAKMYLYEIFSGLDYNNFPKITFIKNTMQLDKMIVVRNIILTSTCEHHFIIFDGIATIAYIPNNIIIGLSKINRIVRFFSSRPQLQERLTQQIFHALQVLLGTNDVAILINAIHFCIKARGIRESNSNTITIALGGEFKSNMIIRQEFFSYTKSSSTY